MRTFVTKRVPGWPGDAMPPRRGGVTGDLESAIFPLMANPETPSAAAAALPRLTQARAPLTREVEVVDEHGASGRVSLPNAT